MSISKSQESEVVELYKTKTIAEIKQIYKTGTSQIYRVLRRNGVEPNKGNQHWEKDGTITPLGYKKITRNGNSILEHRYVMEQHLGRKLSLNENVHHINGNRLDNRIENLELWIKSQPCGQRAEDLVKWAKEILELYDTVDRSGEE